jgi:orotate phosphoribosyltransferase-like protein
MDVAKAAGEHVGRPRNEKRLRRMRKMRDDGMTVNDIADRLECSQEAIYHALARTA